MPGYRKKISYDDFIRDYSNVGERLYLLIVENNLRKRDFFNHFELEKLVMFYRMALYEDTKERILKSINKKSIDEILGLLERKKHDASLMKNLFAKLDVDIICFICDYLYSCKNFELVQNLLDNLEIKKLYQVCACFYKKYKNEKLEHHTVRLLFVKQEDKFNFVIKYKKAA